MVLKLRDPEIEITSCPNDLNQFLSQYINKNISLEFASKSIRTLKPSDGKTFNRRLKVKFKLTKIFFDFQDWFMLVKEK